MPPEAPAPITEVTTQEAPAGDKPVQAEASKAPDASVQSEKPARPEWLGKSFDQYWTDEKGLDADKFNTDYEGLLATKAEAEARAKAIPEKLEDYKVELPKDFVLPEGMKADVLADSPVLQPAREFAKKHGLSADAFKELVGLQAQNEIAQFNQLKTAAAAEKTKLGTNANARVQAVITKANAKLGPELANAILPMMFTAKQVEAVEKLLADAGAPKMSTSGREVTQPTGLSDAEYEAMSPTQRILRANQLAEQKRAKAS